MSSPLASILSIYDYALEPLPALSWLGVPISALDVAGALRLALVLRQVREMLYEAHVAAAAGVKSGRLGKEHAPVSPPEVRGRARDLATTLVMVYGGEAIVGPWLGFQPSFIVSGAIPGLFIATHALVELFPTVPDFAIGTELPAAILDAFTRAMLLCNYVPSLVTQHASPVIAASPWTLLLSSFLTANGGPFLAGAFSLLSPTPMTFTTPPEFLPYGWTATDLWVAPLITGLYATLTHAQPFFTALHTTLFSFFSPLGLATMSYANVTDAKLEGQGEGSIMPVDSDTARAACVLVLGTLFVTRALKNFTPTSESDGRPAVSGKKITTKARPEGSSIDEKRDIKERELAARVAGGKRTGNVNQGGKKKTQ